MDYSYKAECSESLDRYMYEISSIAFLSEDEEKGLASKIKNGSIEARNDLIKAHLKLVTSRAEKYSGRGVPLADLICEGNIGLLFAAEEFDPSKGRFSTIAEYWIKRSIIDAVNAKSGITHTEGSPDRFEAYKDKLKSRLSNRYRNRDVPIEPFAWLNEVLSLDAPFEENSESSILDFLADESQNPEDIVIAKAIEENLKGVLSGLSEIERVYVINYFGLEGHKPMTIDEIADAYKMPVGKVNRTIKNTLRKLRTNERIKALKSFISE